MSDSPKDGLLTALGFQDLPDAVWERVISTCEQFDVRWAEGAKIEDFLQNADPDARPFFLCKLVEIDIEKRRRKGDSPLSADYLARFPGEEQAIRASFAEAGIPFDAAERRPTDDSTDGIPSADTPSPHQPQTPHPLPELPGYELLDKIGEGGMGVVYRARQIGPDRIVAVKMIRASFAGCDEARRRFDAEVRAAGKLRHRNIVAVHDCGEVAGQPYFSMDYIQGRSLDDLRRNPIPARQAAKYVKTVAEAVQHAHDQGLLHRDLKPANILVDVADEPYVTDFGLARALTAGDSDLTVTGEVIGTPSYMPPEQAEGAHQRIDRRSDVYSLGAILYALVTGRPPFSADTRERTLRQVIDDEPVRPRQLIRTLDRDIETICLHCLEKTPASRYGTAGEMAADLDRFLRGESIRARPPGLVRRTARWARRNTWKAAAAFSGLAAVLLIAALAITRTIAAEREHNLRSQAEGLAQKEQASRIRAEGLARQEQEHRERAERLLRLAEARQAALQYERMSRALDENDFDSASVGLGGFPRSQQCLEFRLMERRRLARPEHIASLVEDYWGIVAAVPSPDAKRLVTAYSTGTVLVWDLTTGRVTSRLCEGRWSDELRRRLHHFEARPKDSEMTDWGPCYTGLTWLGDSQRVAAVALDGTVAVFDLKTNTVKTIKRVAEPLYAVASSADGSQVVCSGSSGKLYAASLAAETDTPPVEGESAITAILAIPESKQFLVGRSDGTVELLSAEDLSSQAKWTTPGSIWGLDAKGVKDGWVAVVACEAPAIQMLHVLREGPAIELKATLKPPRTTEQALVYHAVQFSPTGDSVRAVGSSGCLMQWDLKTETLDWSVPVLGRDPRHALQPLAERLPPPLRRVGSLILERSPGEAVGEQLVVAGDDGVIHFLDVSHVDEAKGTTLKVTVGEKPRICFDPEHPGWLWALDQNGLLSVLDCLADARVASRKAHAGQASDMTVINNAKVVATVGGDNLIRFWRCENGQLESARKEIRHDETLIGVASSPDGRWVAAVDATARLIVWDYATGKVVFLTRLGAEGASTTGGAQQRPLTGRLAFNRDGSRLAAFGAGQIAGVFETSPFRRSTEQIWIAGTGGTAMTWSPIDPGFLIAGDNFPRFTEAQFGEISGARKTFPFDPKSTCVAMAVTPDRRRFVLLEQRGAIHFLDAEHFVSLLTLNSRFGKTADLAIDPQGQRLAIAAADGSMEIWNVTAGTKKTNLNVPDALDGWTSSLLIEPTANMIRVQPRTVQVDSRGRVGMLYIESRPGDFREEGALHFVDEAGGYTRRERLEVGDAAHTRRASWDSASLVYGPHDRPVVAFRLRTPVDSSYDGSMYVAHRLGQDQWSFKAIHEHGNMGFYPLLRLDESGLPAELFHYSFGGFHLVRSTPGDGAEWKAQWIGQQGDGANLGGSWSTDGTLHLVFRINRFNSEPEHVIYARWDGRELQRQVIDPFQSISLPQVEFAPDGAPVVLVGKRLMRLGPTGWAEYATLPPLYATLPALAVKSFAINSAGDAYVVSWDAENQRVVLCEGRENSWSAKAIAQFRDGTPPNFFTLRIGAEGKPVVVVGCLHEPYGWLRVLRRKE